MIEIKNTTVNWDNITQWIRNQTQTKASIAEDKSINCTQNSLSVPEENIKNKNFDTSDSSIDFLEMISVRADITAPLYWWLEAGEYKGFSVEKRYNTIYNSFLDKNFTLDDFSHEQLGYDGRSYLEETINLLNFYREKYLDPTTDGFLELSSKKEIWWQLVQMLPQSYNLTQNVEFSYEALSWIYKNEETNNLNEWSFFQEWIEQLPCADLIIKSPWQ